MSCPVLVVPHHAWVSLLITDDPSSEPRHLLWSTIPVWSFRDTASFPVWDQGRYTSSFTLKRRHNLTILTLVT